MTNTEIFIDKYKNLESVVRSTYDLTYNDSISNFLVGQTKYKRYSEDIRYCQEVRNLLSHKQKIDNNFAVEPSQQMIDFIDRLIEQIKNRPKCYEIQIGLKDIYFQPLDGKVKEAIQTMREKLYTHVPIIENGVVIGVFDENSIFNYLADNEIVYIENDLSFRQLDKYISLNNREMEEFVFFKATAYVEELESEIEKSFRKNKRIGVAFITPSGKATEQLQGIITPWDIIASSK